MSRTTYARTAPAPRMGGALRAGAIAIVLILAVVLVSELSGRSHTLPLPLADVGIIREQAASKRIDPALVAAVIYAESKFEPRPSSAGAEGLMQILPATAYYIAHLSGGYRFTTGDLASPRINVSYGTYYLRYLLDHYRGNETLAVAAYNAGLGNVDGWQAKASASGGGTLAPSEIPFPETREYVTKVLAAQNSYRATYPRELGVQ